MTIDEAIARAKEVAKEHEQLAEWLEELKELRSMVKCSAFIDGYNKSINDCAALISKIPGMCGYNCPIDCCRGTEESCKESWRLYLIEQLKGDREDAGSILRAIDTEFKGGHKCIY